MDNIIDLPANLRLVPKERDRGCRCASVYVVEQTRMLECQQCGRVIDPFDFMMKQAKIQQNTAFNIKIARQERQRLEEEIDELKRQKKNLQASVRRLKTSNPG